MTLVIQIYLRPDLQGDENPAPATILHGLNPQPEESSHPDVEELRRQQAESKVDVTLQGEPDREAEVGEDVPGGKHYREENNQNDVHPVLFQLLQPDGMRC